MTTLLAFAVACLIVALLISYDDTYGGILGRRKK